MNTSNSIIITETNKKQGQIGGSMKEPPILPKNVEQDWLKFSLPSITLKYKKEEGFLQVDNASIIVIGDITSSAQLTDEQKRKIDSMSPKEG